MARIRNPRYAPDFLERRLSPSSFGIAPPPADIASSDAAAFAPRTGGEPPLPTDPNGNPIPEPVGDEPGHDIPV